ncbi:hypothetical protein PG984_005570 [Apiospora sp. TS-2023a]
MATQPLPEAPNQSALASSNLPPQTSERPDHDPNDDYESGAETVYSYSSVSPAALSAPNHENNVSKDDVLHWQAFYLRRTVLLCFLVVFLCISIAIEALYLVSKKKNGIATSNSHKSYLWTYGPTAFLTILAAVWGRVEYQSKLIVPWLCLSQPDTPVSRTLLRDYVSQFSLFALFTSLRHCDFLVSITVTVSFAIKAIIVISTGLIILTSVDIEASYPMVIQDEFVDSVARLDSARSASIPITDYIMTGITTANTSLPKGISSGYAFQSVQPKMPANVETRVIVDGLTTSLDCAPAEIQLKEAIYYELYENLLLHMTISSPGCNISKFVMGTMPDYYKHQNTSDRFFARFLSPTKCDGMLGEEGRRMSLISGVLTFYDGNIPTGQNVNTRTPKHQLGVELKNSTQLLCVPEYTLTRVEVVQNGTNTKSVRPIQAKRRTLKSVSAWNITDSSIESGSSMGPFPFKLRGKDGPHDAFDGEINQEARWPFMDHTLDSVSSFTSLSDPKVLQQAATENFRQITSIICKYYLMQLSSENTTGSAIVSQDRLVVQTWAAQWMTGLAMLCASLIAISLFIVPSHAGLPSSPSTIVGIASIVLRSRGLMSKLRYAGLADDEYLGSYLKSSVLQMEYLLSPSTGRAEFLIQEREKIGVDKINRVEHANFRLSHPILLHPACRWALCIGLVATIVTMETLLQESNKNKGIGEDGNESYLHYTWTALPALILGLLAMAFSATDSSVRSLAPYLFLRDTVRRKTLPYIALLDASVPRIIYKELRLASIGILATTGTFLVTSLFTTFSGSLFQVLAVPATAPATLLVNQTFRLEASAGHNGNYIASWIFMSNFTFPRFTYENLAFPELRMGSLALTDDLSNTTTASIAAVIPAVRPKLTCRTYDSSQISRNLTLNYTVGPPDVGMVHQNPLGLWIHGEDCNRDPRSEQYKYNRIFSTSADGTYFGAGGSEEFSTKNGCSDVVYIWGRIDYKADPVLQHVTALGCNISFEIVDVATTFSSTELDLDPQNPPHPDESTVRDSIIRLSGPPGFDDFVKINYAPQILDNFFSILVSSPWAISMSDLGDPSADGRVVDAIKFHHSVILAQGLADGRDPGIVTNTTILTAPNRTGQTDKDLIYNATMTGRSKRRVVQDATATRILEALVGTSLVLFVLGWIKLPRTDVLPRDNVTSIASVVALIAGGNLLSYLPWDAQQLGSEAEIIKALRGGPGLRLWMGWGLVPDVEGRMHGNENEAGESRFGIFAADMEGENDVGEAMDAATAADEEQGNGGV